MVAHDGTRVVYDIATDGGFTMVETPTPPAPPAPPVPGPDPAPMPPPPPPTQGA
jgi:hypothetical protein